MATKRSKHHPGFGLRQSVEKFFISLSPFHSKHAKEEFVVTRRSSQTVANMNGQTPRLATSGPNATTSTEEDRATTPDREFCDEQEDQDITPTSKDQPSYTPAIQNKRVGFADSLPPLFYQDGPSQHFRPDFDLQDSPAYNDRRYSSGHPNLDEDFDIFGRGTKMSKGKKLQKKPSQPSLHIRTPSGYSDEQGLLAPSRSSSAASSSSQPSISRRFSGFFSTSKRNSTPKLPPLPTHVPFPSYNLPPVPSQLPNTPVDELTTDKAALEGRINYHLSQLDGFKVQLSQDNTRIRGLLKDRKLWTNHQLAPQLPAASYLLDQRISIARNARNSLRPAVEWHRGELDAIASKRILMDQEIGVEPRLPQVFSGLTNDYEWNQLFFV